MNIIYEIVNLTNKLNKWSVILPRETKIVQIRKMTKDGSIKGF